MKKIIVFLAFFGAANIVHAQFYNSILPSTAFNDSLTRIVADFRNNFGQIQGNELTPQKEMEVFESAAGLPGAVNCTIYRFHSKVDKSASWQAIMYDGENYEEALKSYKNTFRLISKSRIKWIDKTFINFKGTIQIPEQNVSFATSSLQLDVIDPVYKSFFAEIEITGGFENWQVHLNLFSKKDDTDKL